MDGEDFERSKIHGLQEIPEKQKLEYHEMITPAS